MFPLIRKQSGVLEGGAKVVGPTEERIRVLFSGIYEEGGLPLEREVCASRTKGSRALTAGPKGPGRSGTIEP